MSVVILRPVSELDVTGMVAVGAANSWECIDETTQNGDTDYVTFALGVFQLWNLEGLVILNGQSITRVAVQATVKASPSLPVTQIVSQLRLATEIEGQAYTMAAGGDYQTFTDTWAKNPLTGAAWVTADLAGAAIGHLLNTQDAVKPRLTRLVLLVTLTGPTMEAEPSGLAPRAASAIDPATLSAIPESLGMTATPESLGQSAVPTALDPSRGEPE